jgi:uncharacterized protein with HEPN domain
MKNKIKKCLYDIDQSIKAIESYVADYKFEEYVQTRMLKAAVEREFLIIGEAMNRIVKMDDTINISETSSIISMRNRIVHGYDMIGHTIIWNTIMKNLPQLKQEVQTLLEE